MATAKLHCKTDPGSGMEPVSETLIFRCYVFHPLTHFDNSLPITIECDLSDYVAAGILSQPDENGILHFHLMYEKRLPTEQNNDIYDKELLAIIRAFEEWGSELYSSSVSTTILVKVLLDHPTSSIS